MPLSIARLSSTRASERTLSSGILEHPTDVLYGHIMYVIDIPLPLVIGEVVEQTILNTVQSEYFEVERRNPVYQFEDCLKQVNAALAELAEDGKSDWVGHIHACIALFVNNELYITYTGRVVGAVARSGSYSSIIDSQPGASSRILVHKTFANLASGQLSPGDTIILGNGEIGRHFSPQFLSQCVSESPTSAIQAMFQAARRLHLRFVTAIVARVQTDEAEVATEPYTILLEPSSRSLERTAEENTAVSGQRNSAVAQAWLQSIQESFKALGGVIAQNVKKAFSFVQKNLKSKKIDVEYDTSSEPSDKTDAETADTAIRPPTLQRTPGQKVTTQLIRLYRGTNQWIGHYTPHVRRVPPRTLLIIGSVLIAIVGVSVWQRSHSASSQQQSSTKETTAELDQLKTLLTEATALAQTEPEQARQKVIQAKTSFDKLPATTRTSTTGQTVQNQLFTLLGSLNQVVQIKKDDVSPILADTTNVVVIGQYAFTTQKNSGRIMRQTLGKKDQPEAIATMAGNATIQYMTVVEKNRQLIVASSDRKLFLVDIDGVTHATELLPPEKTSWAAAQSLTWYQKNIYVLEQGSGQIIKSTTQDGTHYTVSSPYLVQSSLSDATAQSITSDGYIYMLFNTGRVIKLLKGTPQAFGPVQLPEPDSAFVQPAKLFTDEAVGSIFVQDQQRLVELTKDGKYVRQYVLPEGTISASFVSPRAKQAWLVVGNELIAFNL